MIPPTKPLCTLLPPAAAAELRRAATTEPSAADPNRRVKAIEKAIAHVKHQHPEFFRKEV